MKKIVLSSLLLVSASAMAETYDLTNRWGVGGGWGYAVPVLGNRFDDLADADQTWNAHIRYNASESKAWVFQYQQHTFDKSTINAKVYDIMYQVRTSPVDRLTPIFGLGGGLADLSNVPGTNSTKLGLKARAGFEWMWTRDIALSATVDYQYINKIPWNHHEGSTPGEIHAIIPQVNLTLFFGHDKEKSDSKKKDPAPVVAAVVADADKDGVSDAKDKCPGTEAGMTVNAYGCVPKEKAHIEVEVFFQTGKAALDANSHAAMEDLANFLKENPGTKAEIQGHTDNVGSDKTNKALSQKRAQAVRDYLVTKLDVPAGRLSSYGYGEEKPVADNTTAEGREKNRRVVAEVTEE
jgi:OmpA-OmpF porin, OOP family